MKRVHLLSLALLSLCTLSNSTIKANAATDGFTFLKGQEGTDYVLEDGKLTTKSGGSVLLESENEFSSFHLSFSSVTKEAYDYNLQYGFIINGSYNNELLNGTLIKTYYNNGGLELEYGYYTDGVYDYMSRWRCDYYCKDTDIMTWDIYVVENTVSVLINNWGICTFYTLQDSGKTYLYTNNMKTDTLFTNISIENITGKIGKYLLREQWKGINCFLPLSTWRSDNSFTLTLPNDLLLDDILELKLLRLTTTDTGCNQTANLYLNDELLGKWETLQISANDYLDAIFDIDLSKVNSKTLNFAIKDLEGEFCASNYRLVYKTNKDVNYIIADSLLYGSSVSETKHNVAGTKAWEGDKVGFIKRGEENRLTYIGIKPGECSYEFNLPTITKKDDITYNFENTKKHDVNLLDYVEISQNTVFDYYNEFWVEKDKLESNVLTLDNDNIEKNWYVDLFVPLQSLGETNNYKLTATGKITTIKHDAYLLNFDTQGGSLIESVEYGVNDNTIKPTDPVKEGYQFGGWYITPDCEKGDEFTFGSPLLNDTTIYAKWVKAIDLDLFKNVELKAGLSFTYKTNDKKEYYNFRDISLYVQYEFDYSNAENVEETGLFVTSDKFDFTQGIENLPENKSIKSVNQNKLNEYVLELENVPVDYTKCSATIKAVSYVKVDGKFYFSKIREESIISMFTKYQAMAEYKDIATSALKEINEAK